MLDIGSLAAGRALLLPAGKSDTALADRSSRTGRRFFEFAPAWSPAVMGWSRCLLFCREGLPADCRTYFFRISRQFSTTVKGTEALCATGTATRKRLPSAVTSTPIKPSGNWNRGLGAPATNTGLALISTDISFPSEAT